MEHSWLVFTIVGVTAVPTILSALMIPRLKTPTTEGYPDFDWDGAMRSIVGGIVGVSSAELSIQLALQSPSRCRLEFMAASGALIPF